MSGKNKPRTFKVPGKPILVAGGINGARRTIMLDALKSANAISDLASCCLGDDLIGQKPHPKSPARTRRGRRRRDASSVKFAEL